jgi:hypothetical protein
MIVAAAIKHNNRVYVGKRHLDIVDSMVTMGIAKKQIFRIDEGFIDHTSSFMNREDSLYHAILNGQIGGEHPCDLPLTSEELW